MATRIPLKFLLQLQKKNLFDYTPAYCPYCNRLTHCILVGSSTAIFWTSPFAILGVSGLFCRFHSIFDGNFFSKQCNPLYTGRLFQCYTLDESIYLFMVCWVYFVTFILFLMKIILVNNVDPDQMPHYVASDLSLHCLPMTLLRVS